MTSPLVFEARSPRNGLPYLFVAQAQKESTVNEALARIDALLRPAVEGESAAPPGKPADGECWIVGTPAQGDWAEREDQLAVYISGSWLFAAPSSGTLVFDRSAAVFRHWQDGWQTVTLPAAPENGGVIDTQAREAIVALIDAMRSFGLGT